MGENENDRLIRLETRFEVLSESFITAVARLEKKLDHREENFVTKDVLNEKLIRVEEKNIALQESVNQIKAERLTEKQTTKQIFPSWISNIIAIIAILIAFLHK